MLILKIKLTQIICMKYTDFDQNSTARRFLLPLSIDADTVLK